VNGKKNKSRRDKNTLRSHSG